jgi:signal transduction histidine kinase/ligand-binding sensor domain-containing protein/CheY-like chemotaxis protein
MRSLSPNRPTLKSLARVALWLALFSGAPVGSLALDPHRTISQFQLDGWKTKQGLPQNSVYAILQSHDGYLWFGTEEGLVRFDGARFTVFDRKNTPELRSNNISSLSQDGAGTLWIGTKGGGVSRRDSGRFTTLTTADGLSNDQVWSLLHARDGAMWIGTAGGLDCLKSGQITTYRTSEGLPDNVVHVLFEDREGNIWAGTNGGLAKISGGRVTSLTTRDGLSKGAVHALYEDGSGTLWIGTAGGGISLLANGVLSTLTTRDGLSSNLVWSILGDRDGNVWIGTHGSGLDRYRDGRFENFSVEDGLAHEWVHALYEDREGSLWLGMNGGGLARFKQGMVTVITTREGLSSDQVATVLEPRDGGLWIGTKEGLVRQNGSTVTVLDAKHGLAADSVMSLCEDRDGSLWIGTPGGGVNHFENGRLTAYTDKDGLSSNLVRVIYQDRAGAVWFGTNVGVTRLDGGAFTSFTTKDGLSNDLVTALFQDRAGAMWIGTYGGGLNRLEGGACTAYTTKDGLTSNNIRFVREDEDGSLWIGTEGGGVNRFADGRFTAVTTREGLFNDTAFEALDDGRGNLWMTCNLGIYRVSIDELRDFFAGRIGSVTSTAFGAADGMRSVEPSGGPQPGVWRARDGKLYFATTGGLVVIDPDALRTNPVPPPVVIEEVLVDGAPVGRDPGVALPAGKRSFEVHYTALSLLVPEKVLFKYRLEGFDEEWVDAGTRRTAFYTNVPSGSYTFRVMACNNDGLWSDGGTNISFRLAPHFYETWWFYVVFGLAAAFGGFAAYRTRIYRLNARQRELVALVDERTRSLRDEKERTEAERVEAQRQRVRAEEANQAKSAFLANMSHELRTPLNAVLGFAQLLNREKGLPSAHREDVEAILHAGEHLLALINDVLNLSKIEAGRQVLSERVFDLSQLLGSIEEMLRLRADEKGLELMVELDEKLPRLVRGDDGKLRQILLNLLGNAVKFTMRGEVALQASWEAGGADGGGRAIFEISDTGPGLTPEEVAAVFTPFVQAGSGVKSGEGTGLGLALSRSLAHLMGGTIALRSELGRGTTFCVEVPLGEARDDERPERAPRDQRKVVALDPDHRGFRVLVVDDVHENRTVLTKLLSSVGFEVFQAENGEEAVRLWETLQPDAVWMDMRMPVMDGLEATRRIRDLETARRPTDTERRTVIIALSASAFEHERESILAAGCDDFLAKPYRETAVFAKMRAHLGARFVYEEQEPVKARADREAFDPARLLDMSPEWRADLLQAVVTGDTEGATGIIAQIEEHDSALGRELAGMVERYQFDRLETLLRAAEERGMPTDAEP